MKATYRQTAYGSHRKSSEQRVRTPRPFSQRVLIYWAAITLGPLLLGISLSMTSYALTASKGLVGDSGGGLTLLLDVAQFLLVAAGMASGLSVMLVGFLCFTKNFNANSTIWASGAIFRMSE